MNNDDVTYILTEMFKRVGLEYDPTFVTKPEWYLEHEWTQEEQDSFKRWITCWLMRKFRYSRRRSTMEATYIVTHVGWKIKTELEIEHE